MAKTHTSIRFRPGGVWSGFIRSLICCPGCSGRLITYYSHMDVGGVPDWLFSLATGSVLFTWLFNSSGGNVVACAFSHGMMDIALMTDLNTADVSAYIGILVTVIGVVVVAVYKKESLSRSTKVTEDG